MSAHFEIVTTDGGDLIGQPYHVRVIADNGEPLLTSENYEHLVDAERVILLVAQMFGAFSPEIPAPHDGQSHVFGSRRAVGIVYTDERGQAVQIVGEDPGAAEVIAAVRPPVKRTARKPRKTAAKPRKPRKTAVKRAARKPRKTTAKRATKPRAK